MAVAGAALVRTERPVPAGASTRSPSGVLGKSAHGGLSLRGRTCCWKRVVIVIFAVEFTIAVVQENADGFP